MYEVFGSVASRAFRVLWTLEELGEDYTLTVAKPRDPVITAVYPAGKVPAMRVGTDILTDSAAIMTFLADKHNALTAPAGTLARAHQDAIMHAILDELDAVLWTAARHTFVLPEEQRVPAVKPSLMWEFNRNVDRLAKRITTPFAAGDTFTIADILLTHCLNWAVGAKFEHENAQIDEYANRMRARDAFKRVRALA
ncbi:MAG: glutathione S-transferase family protein [Planktotalea sp.]|uniref:glutathione S-transferase family protein n=1 Tax=Planktotalea sp. TaxID=2029877 RepID=UPI003C75A1A1